MEKYKWKWIFSETDIICMADIARNEQCHSEYQVSQKSQEI